MDTAAVNSGFSTDSSRKGSWKSRVGNTWLADVDGRSGWARRFRNYLADHLSDIPDASSAEYSILRRAATLETALEKYEIQFAKAGQASIAALENYQRCANTLRRLLLAVGLERRMKDTSVIDARAEEVSRAEAMETRRRYLDQKHEELTAQAAAGVTVDYDR
jgi:hypothetical protein